MCEDVGLLLLGERGEGYDASALREWAVMERMSSGPHSFVFVQVGVNGAMACKKTSCV